MLSELFDDTNSFMAETLISVSVMLICAAYTTMAQLDQRFRRAYLAVTTGLNDIPAFGAFEDFEVDSHLTSDL